MSARKNELSIRGCVLRRVCRTTAIGLPYDYVPLSHRPAQLPVSAMSRIAADGGWSRTEIHIQRPRFQGTLLRDGFYAALQLRLSLLVPVG